MRSAITTPDAPSPAVLVPVAEAARLAGVAEITIRAWIQLGEIAGHLGDWRGIRVDPAEAASARQRRIPGGDVRRGQSHRRHLAEAPRVLAALVESAGDLREACAACGLPAATGANWLRRARRGDPLYAGFLAAVEWQESARAEVKLGVSRLRMLSVIDGMRDGMCMREAARAAGVSRDQVTRWCRKGRGGTEPFAWFAGEYLAQVARQRHLREEGVTARRADLRARQAQRQQQQHAATTARADRSAGFGSVYFVAPVGGGNVKIGFTRYPVVRRLQQLQAASPVPLRVIGVVTAPQEVETALHQAFAGSRAHGEWFRPTWALRRLVARVHRSRVGSAEQLRALLVAQLASREAV